MTKLQNVFNKNMNFIMKIFFRGKTTIFTLASCFLLLEVTIIQENNPIICCS